MNDRLDFLPLAATRPELPTPTLARWQPLRLGLVELFHYDSEEFWFRDGHLLLRGNNGTGKSKVLSLTLPFLFDAQLKPSRIEPDGDPGKKMAWNLLMNGYDRRIGYAWIELGRLGEDGTPRYLTLGAGLSAAAARPTVESWFFIIEGRDGEPGPRIGQDLWLTSPQRVVLTRDRLRDALQNCGQVFETAAVYRRAVDERLFRLGPARYAALMDTLIQLRQPQLSKKPDESSLSNALTEALPPLAKELLGDVADALGQLEEDRRQLDEYEALAQAVSRFDQRYRVYAGVQSRRQARVLRQAQTDFDNASRALNEAQLRLQATLEEEARSIAAREEAVLELARQRARLETLRADPTMQDANRLEEAARVAAARRRDAEDAERRLAEAQQRLQRAEADTRRCAERATQAEGALDEARGEAVEHAAAAGVKGPSADNALIALERAELVNLPPSAFDAAQAGLRALVAARRDQIALLRRRHAELAQAESLLAQRRQGLDERIEDAEAAAERRARADAEVENAGQALLRAWEAHFAALRQLQLDAEAPLPSLADWVANLCGDNPAAQALQSAQQQASRRLAARRIALEGQRQILRDEAQALEQERARLAAGEDAEPPCSYTRDADTRSNRPGAPLWQLIEFRETVDTAQRAGLEAALEAAGLLDAWVSPDGRMQAADGGAPRHDTQALPRPVLHGTALADWLQAAVVPHAPVPADTVARLLAGIACGAQDPSDGEAWIAPDGRFRLGALAGAWGKPAAVYIGFAARAAARERRLAEIAERLRELAAELAALQAQLERQFQDEQEADTEWRSAPLDDALRQAHLAASTCAREWQTARERLTEAEARHREAQQAVQAARCTLADDAADLQLPEAAGTLPVVEDALGRFNDAQHLLAQAARELRLALPELRRQELREAEARQDRQQGEERAAACRIEAEDSQARLEVLREAVGARVEELQQQLAAAVQGAKDSEDIVRRAETRLRETGEARAVAATQAGVAETVLQQRSEARMQAIARLQSFAATGLLSAALPALELPELRSPWTIDPALTLARSAEQLLKDVPADDPSWERVQKQIAEDFTELQRALTALGHQAQAESSDYGLVVGIVYQNRPQRPDQLATRLADEITQRSELLTANEREVLENHLQAEIATEVQRLLQAAERQVDAINKELHKRPTSTGVRFRLQWLPLAEGADGAPVGLEAARKRLLNTAADLWSAEDRRVVGAMLQQRIAAERSRADAGLGRDGGGSLLDQLARALDYRRWHEFRVQRWQDGQWRKLSGPASSGERALGLTVPLFAAVASFYDSQGAWAHAPRLVLLDEAFAGIDDTARAHCMALIREFDLDFVITSEREWGCYAELPGVSICQLQRREGIDAVFVSRWTWDGRSRQRKSDPDRRFAPATP